MQIPAGPSQVADVYKGNPGALQANIQKDKAKNPNIAPDFAKLLALGTVTSEKDNAAKAQALQQLQGLVAQSPTGKPPTIFEQLQAKVAQRSMMGGQQAQPQAQGLPAAAAQQAQPGQGIDQLATDFEFAGGGIVAFSEGGKGKKKDEDVMYDPETGVPISGEESTKGEGLLDKVGRGLSGAYESVANTIFNPENRKAIAEIERQAEARNKPAPAPAPAKPAAPPLTPQQLERIVAQNAAKSAPAPAPQPARPAALAAAAPAAPAEEPSGLQKLLTETYEKGLKQDAHKVAEEDARNVENMMGLKELLAGKRDRISATKAMQARQLADNTDYIDWMLGVARANPRMGLGYALAGGAEASKKAQAERAAQEREFDTVINKLEDGLLEAQITGNREKVSAYTKALDRARAEKSNLVTAATSNVTNEATNKRYIEQNEANRKSNERIAGMRASAAAGAAEQKANLAENRQELAALKTQLASVDKDLTAAAKLSYLPENKAQLPALRAKKAELLEKISALETSGAKTAPAAAPAAAPAGKVLDWNSIK